MPDDGLDLDRLGEYLHVKAPQLGTITDARKFGDGQSNPTFLLTTTAGQFVLRKQPAGELLKSAHAVDREFRAIDALPVILTGISTPLRSAAAPR